jgi:hypothetical protein
LLWDVPVIVKSVIATAWLTQRMVKDVVAAGIFPLSALSLLCGSSASVIGALQMFDVMPFTGGTRRLGLSAPGRPSRNAVRASILRPTTSTRRCCCLTPRPITKPLNCWRKKWGALVALFNGSDPQTLAAASLQPANSHDRVHVISPDVAQLHTAHCKVRPQSLHRGPGRAGGGEELGWLRALGFYHRRSAVQASTVVLAALSA